MKKLISILAIIPVVCVAQGFVHDVVTPIRINGGDGNNSLIKMVSPNQSAPFITASDGTNTIYSVNANGSVLLAATTNVVTYGGTNSAPVNTTNAAVWISVAVKGDTNSYRLPLYK